MKHLFAIALAVFTVASAQASQAQTASAGALAGSNSASGAQSASVLYLDQSNHGNGTATLKTAPPVQAPSMGSGHPCGLGASAGISIIGGGISGGNSRVDEACLLAQMGQGEAALIMIAKRDGDACRALRQVGRIDANSVCAGDPRKRAVASSKSTSAKPALAVKCRNDGGKIVPVVTRAVADAYSSAEIKEVCR